MSIESAVRSVVADDNGQIRASVAENEQKHRANTERMVQSWRSGMQSQMTGESAGASAAFELDNKAVSATNMSTAGRNVSPIGVNGTVEGSDYGVEMG